MTEPIVEWDTPLLGRTRMMALLNKAVDTVNDELRLPDTGAIDAINLVVNYFGCLVDDENATLADAAENYSIANEEELEGRSKLEVIAGWIGG